MTTALQSFSDSFEKSCKKVIKMVDSKRLNNVNLPSSVTSNSTGPLSFPGRAKKESI